MMRDRGFTANDISIPDAKCAITEGVPIARVSTRDGTADAVLFIDTDDRIGIKRVRALLEAFPTSCLVLIALDGATPFAKRELIGVERVHIFLFRELIHNVSRHRLVPKHEMLTGEEAKEVAQKYCMLESQWMILSQNDPVARYYAWPVGAIIRIYRTGVSQDTNIVYRKVAKPRPGG